MYSAIRIRDLREGGCQLYEVPEGEYRVPCGPLSADFTGPLDLFTVSPSDTNPDTLPDAPQELIDLVRGHATRHPLETARYTATARGLRLAALDRLLENARKRPPRSTVAWLSHLGDYVVGALGCRWVDVREPLMTFFSTSPFPLAEEELRAAFIEGISGGSTWEWNCHGRALDEQAKAADDAAEATARERREPEGPSPTNEVTAEELGVIDVTILETLVAAPEAIPAPLRHFVLGPLGPSLDLARRGLLSDGERLHVLIDRSAFYGARFPAKDLAFGVRVEAGDVIPPGTKREVRAKTVTVTLDTRDWLLAARGRRSAPASRASRLSLDGRVRAEQFRALCAQHEVDIIDGRERAIIMSAGAHGFELEDATVARIVFDAAKAAWERVHQKPSDWDAEEERKERTVSFVLPGEKIVPYKRQEWSRPALPFTEEQILSEVASAPVVFSAGELVKEASSTLLDSVLRAAPFLDPFADVIAKAVEGRKTIRTSEVEDALRRAGKIGDGELRPGERQRIGVHLERLGGKRDREGTARVWRFEP